MGETRKGRDELVAELLAVGRERARAGDGRPSPASAAAGIDSEDRTNQMLESLRAMIVEIDERGFMLYVSPSVADILGYAPEELLQRQTLDWVHGDDLASLIEDLRKAAESGRTAKSTYRARHKSGHWVWLETTSSSYQTPEGEARTVAFTRDVSDAKRSDEALRESRDRFAAIAAKASDLITELDAEGRFLYVSPNCGELLGVEPEDLIGRAIEDLSTPDHVHAEDRGDLIGGYRRNLLGTGHGQIELRMRHADGSWHWFECKGASYRTRDGAARAVVICRDVTERRRAEQELRESEERYRIVAETSRDLIIELDPEGRLLYASPTVQTVLGYAPDEVIGTTPFSLLHPDDLERCVAGFLRGIESTRPMETLAFRVRHRDGSWRWIEGAGVSYQRIEGGVRYLAVARDVTERRRAEAERRQLEQRMQQAQKLESLGVMAGGIAHDFNNLLTPILGDASLALMDVAEDSPAATRLLKIKRAAQRAAALTRQMLAYTGKASLHVEVLSLPQLVREMAQLLESAVSRKAVLVYDVPDDLPPVEADAAQISQVVMNLITNASEAITEAKGESRIAIRAGCVYADRAYLDRTELSDPLEEGRYVFFEVEDSGCGMDAETRSRVFDPFFTTKFTGRGLGLAAVMGIVRGHRGAIEIDSAPGRGTRFRVLFPESKRKAASRPAAPPRGEPWRTSGTILVVDDDEAVRELTEETLQRCGLQVLCASGGAEAVELFRKHADEIRAVLLDRTMPSTSGEVAFDAMRSIRPDARIVLASGYSQESTADHFAGKGVAAFLQKPFLPETLVKKMREVLGE